MIEEGKQAEEGQAPLLPCGKLRHNIPPGRNERSYVFPCLPQLTWLHTWSRTRGRVQISMRFRASMGRALCKRARFSAAGLNARKTTEDEMLRMGELAANQTIDTKLDIFLFLVVISYRSAANSSNASVNQESCPLGIKE